jgi:diadenosine tetraphosphate (Ap4A) HIT family hydrolase/8-oxo-dGTP pyrophosphatase MutT (NUDIX family)
MTWPADWSERLSGARCHLCDEGRPDETDYGLRIARSDVADSYLARRAAQPGYAIVVWRGRHVVEPFELSADEADRYWAQVTHVGAAVRRHFDAAKVNFQTLGNGTPHLHTHVSARYLNDVAPGRPLPVDRSTPIPAERLNGDAAALRRLLDGTETDERLAYLQRLPAKRMGVGALFTDEAGRVLLVRPTYRPEWLVPGGIVERDESPRTACAREVAEELGVDLPVGELLCLEYKPPQPGRSDESLQMIFDGGTITLDATRFACRDGEIDGYEYVETAELDQRLTPHLARRVRAALAARDHDGVVYHEWT